MKKYVVYVKETHLQPVLVEAENEVKAKEKVADGDGSYSASRYHDTKEPELWHVEEA